VQIVVEIVVEMVVGISEGGEGRWGEGESALFILSE
jgi:hypothetical protein